MAKVVARPHVWLAASILWVAPAVCAQEQPASDEVKISGQMYTAHPLYTFRVESRIVDVGAVVRDGHGRAVAGLKREDFRILDEGKEVTIASFSEDRAAPVRSTAAAVPAPKTGGTVTAPAAEGGRQGPQRFLALFFDDVNSTNGEDAGDLKRAQTAATRFVKASLDPDVRIGVFTVSGAQTLDFTSDSGKVTAAIAELKPHPRFTTKDCPAINPYQAFRIAQERDQETLRLVVTASTQHKCPATANDVVVQSEEIWRTVKQISTETLAATGRLVSYLSGKPGERVLVLASSGFAAETLEPQQDRIIQLAVHSGVVINGLVTKGLYNELTPGERFSDPPPPHALSTVSPRYQGWMKAENAAVAERPIVMDEAMANLARGTGGVLFHNNNDLNAGFRETSVGPEATYRMTFSPEGVVSDGSFHELKVSLVHGAGHSVEARPGYFAQEMVVPDPLRTRLESEVLSMDAQAGVAAGVALRLEKRPDGGRLVRVFIHVDVSKLVFVRHNDRQTQRINFVAAFFNDQGKMVDAKEGRMDLALKPDTYTRLLESGVTGELSFEMPAGLYKLRAVVTEAVNSNLAASTYPIDVR